MRVYLTKRYSFAAAHRLHNDAWSAEENRRVYGKCNSPYGHGHNYALEVTLSGPVDPRTGMVCDLGELDAVVEREILARLDHEHLNTVPAFAGLVPTSENVAAGVYEILEREFHAAHLERVKLEETSQNYFEYAGGSEIRR
jgi:6-pyruvoyltetrahydropterin/6-carboxytetrahydropterin synthase